MSPNIEITIWLEKYVRESWHYDENDNVVVIGNINIADKLMEKLPVKFAKVTGTMRFAGCKKLKSVEGFPVEVHDIFMEDCLFPQAIYGEAYHNKKTLEESLDENFEEVYESPYLLETVKTTFPALYEQKKGYIASKRFGF
jgi:hypothetical protein